MSWSPDFFTKKQIQVHNKTTPHRIEKIKTVILLSVLPILTKVFQKSQIFSALLQEMAKQSTELLVLFNSTRSHFSLPRFSQFKTKQNIGNSFFSENM